jgi:hypothetical protein
MSQIGVQPKKHLSAALNGWFVGNTDLNDEMWSLNGVFAPTFRFAIPGFVVGPSWPPEQPASLDDKTIGRDSNVQTNKMPQK